MTATSINWCNKASCADPTATPLGLGQRNRTGPFTASACFQMNVGQPVPFVFVGDVPNQSGTGPRTVGNGQAIANEHWGLFPYPFVFSGPLPTHSAIVGVGLADGNYNPAVDDDHQDFTVRFTALPGSTPTQNIPTLGEWGADRARDGDGDDRFALSASRRALTPMRARTIHDRRCVCCRKLRRHRVRQRAG